jgi:DNA polymerase-3 subunit gamma/tau
MADAPTDLVRRLQAAMERLTGEEWEVLAEAGAAAPGVESLAERRAREEAELAKSAAAHPLVAEALAAFPGAKIVAVRKPPRTGAEAAGAVTPFRNPNDKREGSAS